MDDTKEKGDQMIKSMTGFGQVTKKYEKSLITLEIKTVNHRFLDVSFKMPRDLSVFEDLMKKIIRKYIKRGRVDLFINVQGESLRQQEIQVNWPLLEQYMNHAEEIRSRTTIKGKLEIKDLLQIEHIFNVEEEAQFEENFSTVLTELLDEGLKQVVAMRQDEGQSLKNDIVMHLNDLNHYIDELHHQSPLLKEQYAEKILKRLKEYLNDVSFDESRILQEIALLADKSDITEEITRLKSHIAQFKSIIEMKESVGRKLDFLTQEMLREVNTIGSKSQHASISKQVVDMKSEIEKIKEQVQNIE